MIDRSIEASDSGLLAVLGATGFIGSAIVRAAQREKLPYRSVSRRAVEGTAFMQADLRDGVSLQHAFEGSEVVFHAAGYIGYDPDECHHINIVGTQNVVKAYKSSGARRLIYASTTSVYGRGPHRGVVEGDIPVNPDSVLSQSRARAEEIVLEAGGIVVRPHLVCGKYDQRTISQIAKLVWALQAHLEAATVQSIIDVDTLAQALIRLSCVAAPVQNVFHATSQPVTSRDVWAFVSQLFSLPEITATISTEQAIAKTRGYPNAEAGIALFAVDQTYNSAALAQATGTELNVPVFSEQATSWYVQSLAASLGRSR